MKNTKQLLEHFIFYKKPVYFACEIILTKVPKYF